MISSMGHSPYSRYAAGVPFLMHGSVPTEKTIQNYRQRGGQIVAYRFSKFQPNAIIKQGILQSGDDLFSCHSIRLTRSCLLTYTKMLKY